MIRRALAPPFVLLLALVAALALWLRPDEGGLRRHGGAARRGLAIEELAWPGGTGHPPCRAGRATPLDGTSPLTLASAWRGLLLEDVAVPLAEGLELRAPRGTLLADRLVLQGEVVVDRGFSRALTAGRVEFRGSRVHFPGVVVFGDPGGSHQAVDLELGIAELAARLR